MAEKESLFDAASALAASEKLMDQFDRANKALELLGSMTGVQEAGEYRSIKRTLTARADAFLEAANIIEHHFGVSRHKQFEPEDGFGI